MLEIPNFVAYINWVPFKHKYSQNIVSPGGGTGAFTWWSGASLLNHPTKNTAIVGTWDSGGSSGELRVNEGILPPGDYMQCLLAMMEDQNQREEAILILRDRSSGHPIVNLLGTYAEKYHHSVQGGINGLRQLFRVRGNIIPVSLTDIHLFSETKNGKKYCNEHEIDEIKDDPGFKFEDKISRIYFDVKPEVNPEALNSLKKADKIVIPPGSPYTSIFPHLLIPGFSNAILESKAKLVVVLNLMTTSGEDHHLNYASRWLHVFQYYLGDFEYIKKHKKSRIHSMVVNKNNLSKEIIEIYKNKGQAPIRVDEQKCAKQAPGMKIITKQVADYDKDTNLFRHNPIKLAEVVLSL